MMLKPVLRSLLLTVCASVLVSGCELPVLPKNMTSANDTVVIDLDAIAAALGRDAALREQLSNANQQLGTQVSELAQGLKGKLEAEKEKLGETPSDEAQADFRRLAAQAQLQLRRGQATARQRAQQFQLQLVSKFRAEVVPFAQAIASNQGARVVVMKSTALWFDPSADITQAVIDAMRAAQAGQTPAASKEKSDG